MIVPYKKLLILFLITSLIACENAENQPESKDQSVANSSFNDADSYVADIEAAELKIAQSLSYGKEDGSSMEVLLFANDSNEVVKLVEYRAKSSGASVESTLFYYKDNLKFITKEYYDVTKGDVTGFVERVTYYENGKPKIAKQRKASFEELLDNEQFNIVTAKDCSDERAYRALKQEGEFETTFQGFVQSEDLLYLLVGPNTPDGYVSSLVVQLTTPVIQKLLNNEKSMIGKKLQISFETMTGNNNFEFQVLTDVQLKD